MSNGNRIGYFSVSFSKPSGNPLGLRKTLEKVGIQPAEFSAVYKNQQGRDTKPRIWVFTALHYEELSKINIINRLYAKALNAPATRFRCYWYRYGINTLNRWQHRSSTGLAGWQHRVNTVPQNDTGNLRTVIFQQATLYKHLPVTFPGFG